MYELRLLGGASLDGPDGPVTGRAGQRRPLALLALLAVAGDSGLSRDKIVGYLWPETRTKRARHLLSVSLHAVRKALGSEAVESVADDLRLNTDVVSVDLAAFERALDAEELERAVVLYDGPFLDGFHVRDASPFERWQDGRRAAYARTYRRALEELAERAEERGEWSEAVRWWKERATEDPTSSRVAVRLMEALEASGDRPAALRHAKIHARLVKDQLGMAPDPEVEEFASSLETRPRPASKVAESPPATGDGEAPEPEVRAGTREPTDRLPLPGSDWKTLAALGLVLLGAVYLWSLDEYESLTTATAAERATVSVAVLPFTADGDQALAHLEHAIPELLARALDGAGRLVTIDPDSVGRRSSAGGEPFLVGSGAELHVSGSVVGNGSGLRVVAVVESPSRGGELVARATVDDRAEELFRLVDRLATSLIVQLHPGPAHRHLRAAARSTDSVRALKAFLQAERTFRRSGSHSALEPLRRAVAIDTGFAAGHYRLAVMAARAWDPELARRSVDRALRLGDRVGEDERELYRAFRDYLRGDAEAAVRRYRDLLDGDVLNIEAWRFLGTTLRIFNPMRGRPTEEAREPYRRVLSLDSTDVPALLGLAGVELDAGRIATWDALVHRALGPARHARWRTRNAFALYHFGTREQLEERLRRIETYPAALVHRQAMSFSRLADLSPARRLAGLLTAEAQPAEWKAAGHALLAELALAGGRPGEAETALAAAEALDPRRALGARAVLATLPHARMPSAELGSLRDELRSWTPANRVPADPRLRRPLLEREIGPVLRPYFLGLLSAALGDGEAARRRAAELDAMQGPAGLEELSGDLALGIRAEVQRVLGDPAGALRVLERLELRVPRHRISESPFHVRVRERFLRGDLLRELGRRREALGWLEGVAREGMGLLYRARASVLAAELREELGDERRAALFYDRAATLLADCAPAYAPLLARARAGSERLTGVEGETSRWAPGTGADGEAPARARSSTG